MPFLHQSNLLLCACSTMKKYTESAQRCLIELFIDSITLLHCQMLHFEVKMLMAIDKGLLIFYNNKLLYIQ